MVITITTKEAFEINFFVPDSKSIIKRSFINWGQIPKNLYTDLTVLSSQVKIWTISYGDFLTEQTSI